MSNASILPIYNQNDSNNYSSLSLFLVPDHPLNQLFQSTSTSCPDSNQSSNTPMKTDLTLRLPSPTSTSHSNSFTVCSTPSIPSPSSTSNLNSLSPISVSSPPSYAQLYLNATAISQDPNSPRQLATKKHIETVSMIVSSGNVCSTNPSPSSTKQPAEAQRGINYLLTASNKPQSLKSTPNKKTKSKSKQFLSSINPSIGETGLPVSEKKVKKNQKKPKNGRRRSANSILRCEICNEMYSRKDNLRAHQRVHSGEKPFKCSYCGTRFRWMGAWRSHEMLHKRRDEKTHNASMPLKKTVKRKVIDNQTVSNSDLTHLEIESDSNSNSTQLQTTRFNGKTNQNIVQDRSQANVESESEQSFNMDTTSTTNVTCDTGKGVDIDVGAITHGRATVSVENVIQTAHASQGILTSSVSGMCTIMQNAPINNLRSTCNTNNLMNTCSDNDQTQVHELKCNPSLSRLNCTSDSFEDMSANHLNSAALNLVQVVTDEDIYISNGMFSPSSNQEIFPAILDCDLAAETPNQSY